MMMIIMRNNMVIGGIIGQRIMFKETIKQNKVDKYIMKQYFFPVYKYNSYKKLT